MATTRRCLTAALLAWGALVSGCDDPPPLPAALHGALYLDASGTPAFAVGADAVARIPAGLTSPRATLERDGQTWPVELVRVSAPAPEHALLRLRLPDVPPGRYTLRVDAGDRSPARRAVRMVEPPAGRLASLHATIGAAPASARSAMWAEAARTLPEQDRHWARVERARAHRRAGDLAASVTAWLDAAERVPPAQASEASRCLRAAAHGLVSLRRLDEVAPLLERAAAIDERLDDEAGRARLAFYRGLLALERGDFRGAAARSAEAARRARSIGFGAGWVTAVEQQAAVWVAMGRFDEARRALAEVRRWAFEEGGPLDRARLATNEAWVEIAGARQGFEGDLEGARQRLAAVLKEAEPEAWYRANLHANLATIELLRGQLVEAEGHLAAAGGLGSGYTALLAGEIALGSGHLEKARAAFEAARRMSFAESGDGRDDVQWRALHGLARALARRTLAGAPGGPESQGARGSRAAPSRAGRARENSTPAGSLAEGAARAVANDEERAGGAPSGEDGAGSTSAIGRVDVSPAPVDARAAYEAALAALDQVGRRTGILEDRAPFLSTRRALIHDAARFFLERGEAARALVVLDAARARVLRALQNDLTGRALVGPKARRLARLDADYEATRREAVAVAERCARAPDDKRGACAAELKAARGRAARRFEARQAFLDAGRPGWRPASAKAMLAGLSEGAVVLALHRLEPRRSDRARSLDGDARPARPSGPDAAREPAPARARGVTAANLRPGVARPAGAGAGRRTHAGAGSPAAELHAFALANGRVSHRRVETAAEALDWVRTQVGGAPRVFVVDGQEAAPLRAAPVTWLPYAGLLAEPARSAQAPALVVADPTRDLPGALAEGRAAHGRVGGRLLVGAEATEAGVLAALDGARVFHFAGHGVLDGRSPWDAHLALADGGRLALTSLLVARPAAGLVVLSGCETGRAQTLAGDEVVGLPHTFLAMGSGAVLAAEQRLDDEATRRFFSAFYAAGGDAEPVAAFHATTAKLAAAGDSTARGFRLWARP